MVLVLPKADPAIPLIKEIAEKAQFTLTERLPKDEGKVNLVYAGAVETWGDAAQQDSCDEQWNLRCSHSRLNDTDSEEAIIMEVSIGGEQGGTLPGQHRGFP